MFVGSWRSVQHVRQWRWLWRSWSASLRWWYGLWTAAWISLTLWTVALYIQAQRFTPSAGLFAGLGVVTSFIAVCATMLILGVVDLLLWLPRAQHLVWPFSRWLDRAARIQQHRWELLLLIGMMAGIGLAVQFFVGLPLGGG